LGPQCPPDAALIVLTADQINSFVDFHNSKRSIVASGQLQGYNAAKNMPYLVSWLFARKHFLNFTMSAMNRFILYFILQQWDMELAYLAGLNAKTCIFAHDKCRNTGNSAIICANWLLIKELFLLICRCLQICWTKYRNKIWFQGLSKCQHFYQQP
jgi:hypothetical protein